MGSIQDIVHYCCVARDNRILYSYGNNGDDIASLCLEKAPPFHRWYFETTGKRTFCFLIEGGYVYFLIADENVGIPEILRFVERFRDEFEKVAKKGSIGSSLNMNSVHVHEQLVPVVRRLIASLENASRWTDGGVSPSAGPAEGSTSSTKAPLLGKSNRKTKDHHHHVIGIEEHRKSSDREGNNNNNNNNASTSAEVDHSGQRGEKDSSSASRVRSASQAVRKKWWHQVRIVLAVDALVCLVLFAIWLGICRGFKCIH